LAISKPCKADWDKMRQTEQGKHCAQCNKSVTDFTNYTDKELIEFFKNAKGNICGRLEPYQVNRVLPINKTNSNSFIYKAIFGSAIAASIVTAVNGQDISQNTTGQVANAGKDHPTIKVSKKHPEALHYIKGKIVDSKTKVSIGSGASISIKGTDISTTTDIYGAFALPVPNSILSKKVTLIADYYNYKEKSTTISSGSYMNFLTIMLKPIPLRNRKANTFIQGEITRFL